MAGYWELREKCRIRQRTICNPPSQHVLESETQLYYYYCDTLIEMAENIRAITTDKNIHTLINNAMEQLNGQSMEADRK